MNILSERSRLAGLILLISVAVVGWSLPASAEGEGRAKISLRSLTVNGRPFSQFIARTATQRAASPLAGHLSSDSGQIVGSGTRCARATSHRPRRRALARVWAGSATCDLIGRRHDDRS